MPRKAREKSPYGIYHVILRGNGKRMIFMDDDDCRFFLRQLGRLRTELGFKIYAFCLMGNHVHLLIRESENTLETLFRRAATTYALYFNDKYESTGHLFQDRYKSEIVDSEKYFFSALRYICQNPVKAGLCANPKDYPWLGCAGIWNRTMKTDCLKELTGFDDHRLEQFLMQPCSGTHIEFDDEGRMDDRKAAGLLCEMFSCDDPWELSRRPKEEQKTVIKRAAENGIRRKQLARITGISRYLIDQTLQK